MRPPQRSARMPDPKSVSPKLTRLATATGRAFEHVEMPIGEGIKGSGVDAEFHGRDQSQDCTASRYGEEVLCQTHPAWPQMCGGTIM